MKKSFAVVSLCTGLAACSLSPVHYYSLQSTASTEVVNHVVDAHEQSVGVGPITLPRLLNRPQIVHRVSSSELIFEEDHQWGGRLQEEMSQLLTQTLQQAHPQQLVYAYPAENRVMPAYQWSVDVQQLDGVLGGVVQLHATCRLYAKHRKQMVFDRQVVLSQKMASSDMAAYVLAQHDLLMQLAKRCDWSDTMLVQP